MIINSIRTVYQKVFPEYFRRGVWKSIHKSVAFKNTFLKQFLNNTKLGGKIREHTDPLKPLLSLPALYKKTVKQSDKPKSSLNYNRHEYKSTWNDLSTSNHRATVSVIGDVGEDVIQATANHTKDTLERHVKIYPNDIILEIGCGIGRVGHVLAPICKQWVGCDVSANMLKHAGERLAEFDNVKLVEISGLDLSPIDDSSIDLVYCTVVFMHLEDIDRFNYVLESYRILKPGGRIFIDNFNLCSREGWEIFENDRQLYTYDKNRPPHFARSSTSQELKMYLKRAGFKKVKIKVECAWVQGIGIKPEK